MHCHSTASDGQLAPEAVARRAHEVGLAAIALTDHDTLGGIAAAAAAAQ
ncbi:MAG: PHP domain-containing protein, partial [Gemmatimonadales bacterium]